MITNKQKDKWKELENLKFTEKQTEILIGSMLGDGSLISPQKQTHNSYFTENHCLAQSGYVDFKASELGVFTSRVVNIKKSSRNGFKDGRPRNENKNRIVRMFATIRHSLFTEMEKKWYKRDENGNYVLNDKDKRIKIIPKEDINLTPLILAIWYLDDGWQDPKRRRAGLCTDGFTVEEVEFLCSKLRYLNIQCFISFHEGNPEIRISSYSYKLFIDIISPFVTMDCMKYKVDLSLYKPSTWTSTEVINEILLLKNRGLPRKNIADIFNMNINTLDGILYRHNK